MSRPALTACAIASSMSAATWYLVIRVLDVLPVGDHDALEVQLAAQDVGEQAVRGVAGHAVDRAAVDHHGRDAGVDALLRTTAGGCSAARCRRSSRRCGRGRCRAPSSPRSAWRWRRRTSGSPGRGPAGRGSWRRPSRRSAAGPRRRARRSGPSAGRARCRARGRSPTSTPVARTALRGGAAQLLCQRRVEGGAEADLVGDHRGVDEVVVAVDGVGAVDDRDAAAGCGRARTAGWC